MTRITVRDLKQNPSRWLQRARDGERVEVAPGGDDSQVVVLVPLAAMESTDPWQALEQAGALASAPLAGSAWPEQRLGGSLADGVLAERADDPR